MKPRILEPVLARISQQNSLGLSGWYEVIYCDEIGWKSYENGTTFKNGEQVEEWIYCDEALTA
jgi:hypothetical protein